MSAPPPPASHAAAPADDERVVACPHADRCPGCDHIGVPYGAQLQAKRATVAAALAPYAEHARIEIAPTRGAEPIAGYRTRAKWVAGPGGATLGLYARGTHTVVDLPGCAVASDVVASATAAVRALVRSARCPALSASLRAIDAREIHEADGAVSCLLTLVLVREQRPQRREIAAAARLLAEAEPRIAGVSVNWVAARAVQILGDETETVLGVGELLDRQGDVLVTATPGSFVQAHRGQAAAMATRLVEGAARLAREADPPRTRLRVLELFAGAAPFGLALARAGHAVTSVESFAPAAEGVARAARAQGIAITSLAEDATRAAVRAAREGASFDLVVVDPPRRGLPPALRAALADLGPRAIAYVSCDAATLARDLAHLAHLGLRAGDVAPWDFIPSSAHAEALAWIAPSPPPALEVVDHRGAHALVAVPPHVDPRWIAERADRELGTGRLIGPWWPGASGALFVGATSVVGRARILAAIRGRPRRDLRGPWSALSVERSTQGRSLVVLDATLEVLPRLGPALARAGHPVLGDPADAATARHLLEKHGVDRPLVHVAEVRASAPATLQPSRGADIPGDLSTALERLDLR